MTSGYTDCACRDCFDIAIGDMKRDHHTLCSACADAGCSRYGDEECQRDDAYGADELCAHGNWLCSEPGCENNHTEGA